MTLIVCYSTLLVAGDVPSYHLTGNPTVDFWGLPKSAHLMEANKSAVYRFQESTDQTDNEKSPILAGLMSLALPGAGEFYTKEYTKSAAFLGVEVASWIVYAVYQHKGDKQTAWFKAYADEHYSASRYAEWVIRNIGTLNSTIDLSTYNLFYSGADTNGGPPFSALNWPELNRLEGNIPDFTHRLPYYGAQQYYELIGKYKQFSKGWDSQIGDDANYKDGNDQFFYYGVEFNKADHYYSVADAFISVVVANHILSALDAVWSASNFNKALHAEARMDMQRTPYGYEPGARFDLQVFF
jgi:hypothetical protein